jgi:hypothetical protein
VGTDVPAREVGRLPVEADVAKGKSGAVDRQPGDVEWAIGTGGDALDQRAAYSDPHRPMGKAMQRRDVG